MGMMKESIKLHHSNYILKYINVQENDWDKHLEEFLLSYRTSVHASTMVTMLQDYLMVTASQGHLMGTMLQEHPHLMTMTVSQDHLMVAVQQDYLMVTVTRVDNVNGGDAVRDDDEERSADKEKDDEQTQQCMASICSEGKRNENGQRYGA